MADDAASAAADGDGLIFQWEHRARSPWWLVLMLVASLLVHAVSFYALQVAYTPTGTQLPPPAQVVLVPLDQPENAPFARWLAMNDPALTTRPAAPAAAEVVDALGFHYLASYNASQPPFKPLEQPADIVHTIPVRSSLPGPVPVALPMVAPAPRDFGRVTRVTLTGPVATAAGAPLPAVHFLVSESAAVLDSTVFVVGVRPEGGEPFLFRQATSGSAAADEYARRYLASLGLRPAPGPNAGVAWGTVAFDWGNDVYR